MCFFLICLFVFTLTSMVSWNIFKPFQHMPSKVYRPKYFQRNPRRGDYLFDHCLKESHHFVPPVKPAFVLWLLLKLSFFLGDQEEMNCGLWGNTKWWENNLFFVEILDLRCRRTISQGVKDPFSQRKRYPTEGPEGVTPTKPIHFYCGIKGEIQWIPVIPFSQVCN